MANKLNMAIAKTHRLSTRLIGMQLTGGTFIGIALSATQMAAGFLVVGQPIVNGNAFMFILIALIGVALALLVERLSLGGLSAVRVAREHRKRLEENYYGMLRSEQRDPTPTEEDHFLRQFKTLKGEGRTAGCFAALGMLLSAGIGDVFWHTLFEPLGPMGYVLSTACAAVIGLTFVHSELYKAVVDGVLKEILADMHLMKVAVAAEGENMQVDMMVEAFEGLRENEEVYRPAADKVQRSLGKRLTNFANQVSAVSEEISALNAGTTIIEGSVSYPPALPAPRGKYYQHKAELSRLLRANPQLSQRDIAKHFGISRSTANEWFQKLKSRQ